MRVMHLSIKLFTPTSSGTGDCFFESFFFFFTPFNCSGALFLLEVEHLHRGEKSFRGGSKCNIIIIYFFLQISHCLQPWQDKRWAPPAGETDRIEWVKTAANGYYLKDWTVIAYDSNKQKRLLSEWYLSNLPLHCQFLLLILFFKLHVFCIL